MRPVYMPGSIAELLDLRSGFPDGLIMAGGTDLLVRLRKAEPDDRPIFCLERIAELKTIDETPGEIRIGAAATLAEIARNRLVNSHFPLLAKAAASVGGPAIRNMGTLGGNICTASPAGDTLPALHVAGARLELASPHGRRTLPIDAFISGPGKTDLAPDELLVSIRIPAADDFSIQHFEKVGRRNALAIAVASLAAMIRTDADGRVAEARFAWGSVGPYVVRCPGAEARVRGEFLTEAILAEAGALAKLTVRPIDDIRAGAEYRRTLAANLLLRIVAP